MCRLRVKRVYRTVWWLHRSFTQLNKQKCPTKNVTEPNKSNTVTVTVFSNLYEKSCRYTWRSVCPPVCPTDSLSHFYPKNSVCHRQKTLTHRVFVMKINHGDGQHSRLRLQWTFPRGNSLRPTRLTGGTLWKHLEITLTSSSWWYRHASLGAAAPAFCVNSWRFVFGDASLCVNLHRWRIGEPPVVLMQRLCVKGATYYYSYGWTWTGSCVAILPSHTARQVRRSECFDFGFDTCVVTALEMMVSVNTYILTWQKQLS